MTQLSIPIEIKPLYYKGLLLKPKKGYSNHFCSTGFKVRKFVVGDKDSRGFLNLHERDLQGFNWLLTESEITRFFESYVK